MTRSLAVVLLALALVAPGAEAREPWSWPVRGELIGPYRNGDDPYAAGQHRGIDIAAPAGTPVRAASGGTVRFAGPLGSAGNVVSIRTDGLDASYLHLGSIVVRVGTRVSAGERIGTVGTTGRRSASEPHLHLGVREAGERHAYRDPLTFLPPPAATRPRPAPRPVPLPLPAPRDSLPAPAPPPPAGPAPLRAPRALRIPEAAPLPLGAPVPGLPRLPRTAPLPIPSIPGALRHATETVRVPGAGPAPGAPAAAAAGVARGRSAAREPRAVDAGWLAACVALVTAAALLARPRGPAESLRRGRRLAASASAPPPGPVAPEAADSIATWPTTSPRRSTT